MTPLSQEALVFLHGISVAIGEARETGPLLRKILESTAVTIGCDAGLVRLWEPDQGVLVLGETYGLSQAFVSAVGPIGLDEGPIGRVARSRAPAWARTEELPDIPLRRAFQAEGIQSFAATPLLSVGSLVGVLVFHSLRPREFTDSDLQFLAAVGNHLGPTVANSRLLSSYSAAVERLRLTLSLIREVTGAFEPRSILSSLLKKAAELAEARYSALAVLDAVGKIEEFLVTGLDPETEAHLRDQGTPEGRGLLGALITGRRPIRLEDLTRDPRSSGFPPRHPHMKSFLGAPILRGDRILGTLYMTEKKDAAAFTGLDEEAVMALASEAAIAIERSRLYARERERRLYLEKFAEIDRSLAGELDPDRLLPLLLSETVKLLKGGGGGIYSWDEETQALRVQVSEGYGSWIDDLRIRPGEGVVGRVFQEQWGTVINNYTEWAGRIDDFAAEGSQAVVAAVLAFGGETFGVIAVDRRAPLLPFTEDDLLLLQDLATRAAAALRSARLIRSLQEQLRVVKETQGRLIQAEKLSALGNLTAGIAHELNNPLSVVIGRLQLLEEGEWPEATRRQIERIREQAERAARIVENLLVFSRRRTERREPSDLNRVAEKALELHAPSLSAEHIVADLALDPRVPQISADPYQLQQVVVNLIQNARHAMKPRGRGRLALRTVFRPEVPSVVIEVDDDGPGIPPEILSRVFDPFVTTKGPGEGTGLGLSICHTIVSSHGGWIRAQNLPGNGARFTVEVPAVATEPRGASPAVVPLPSIAGARILVVDDELPVREVLRDLLVELGAVVEEAVSGPEALALLRRSRFDLMTLDFRMPEMNAPEVWWMIHREFAGLRIILVTGDVFGPEVAEFVERSGLSLIHKPFSLEEVRRAITTALER